MVYNSIRKKHLTVVLLLCSVLATMVDGRVPVDFTDLDGDVEQSSGSASLKDFDSAFYGFTRLLSSGINLKQSADDGIYATKNEENFDLVNAFLAGFKSDESFPSAVNCSTYLEQSIDVLNITKQEWAETDAGVQEYIFDSAYWVSYSMGPSSRYCFMVGMELYSWGWTKAEVYEGFVDAFLAWLQNLLGSVITFNALYKKITESSEAENQREMMYWYGRLCTLIFNFDPIPEDQLEFERDTTGGDIFDPNSITELIAGIGSMYGASQASQIKERTFHSAINEETPAFVRSPRVSNTWDDMYGFSAGLIQAGFGDAAPNSSVCNTNITRIVDNTIGFIEELRIHSNESLNASAQSFENILGSLYPITYSCYHSVFEYGEVALMYGDTITDGLQLLYNLIHKLGNIYDCFFFLVHHHKNTPFGQNPDNEIIIIDGEEVIAAEVDPDITEEEIAQLEFEAQQAYGNAKEEWWFKLGIYYGTLVYLFFFPDEPMQDDWNPSQNIDNTVNLVSKIGLTVLKNL